MFFHHQTIRKYTAAILELFNDIEVQYLDSKNQTKAFKVPIQFSSKEKANILSQYGESGELKQILQTRNTTVLPRMCLIFESLEPSLTRARNKFTKINKVVDNKKMSFQYNSIPYDFNYRIVLQTRGMNEAAMVVEQIASYFNPSYTLLINEIPFSDYTSVVLDLNGIDIDQQDYDEYSTNLVTVTFNLKIRGNIYPPIKEQEKIKQIDIFINEIRKDNKYKRLELIQNHVFDKKVKDIKIHLFTKQRIPYISDIVYLDNKLEVVFEDLDNKIEFNEFIYVWEATGVNKIGTGSKVVEISKNKGDTEVTVFIVDYHGNKSNIFKKVISI